MHDPEANFANECAQSIAEMSADAGLHNAAAAFVNQAVQHKYAYNFRALGRPIIQFPQDMVAVQELIFDVRPDLIIETGIAHGGSLIQSASMLALLDIIDAIEAGSTNINPAISDRRVVGIDIDIREHNRIAIESHSMASRIKMLEGSSIDEKIVAQVCELASSASSVLVFLDSNHTHDHVLEELKCYAHLATIDSYCVVFDTIVEDMPASLSDDRPWRPGNNPKTAVWEFLKSTDKFLIDHELENKLQLTVAPDGFLKRVR